MDLLREVHIESQILALVEDYRSSHPKGYFGSSNMWRYLNKNLAEMYNIDVDIRSLLSRMKKDIIKDVRVCEDQSKKVDLFLDLIKNYLPLFDVIAPRSVTVQDIMDESLRCLRKRTAKRKLRPDIRRTTILNKDCSNSKVGRILNNFKPTSCSLAQEHSVNNYRPSTSKDIVSCSLPMKSKLKDFDYNRQKSNKLKLSTSNTCRAECVSSGHHSNNADLLGSSSFGDSNFNESLVFKDPGPFNFKDRLSKNKEALPRPVENNYSGNIGNSSSVKEVIVSDRTIKTAAVKPYTNPPPESTTLPSTSYNMTDQSFHQRLYGSVQRGHLRSNQQVTQSNQQTMHIDESDLVGNQRVLQNSQIPPPIPDRVTTSNSDVPNPQYSNFLPASFYRQFEMARNRGSLTNRNYILPQWFEDMIRNNRAFEMMRLRELFQAERAYMDLECRKLNALEKISKAFQRTI